MSEPKYGVAVPSDEIPYIDDASPFDPPPTTPYAPVPGEVGKGSIGKMSKVIYWYGIMSALLALTALPSLVIAFLLAQDASNIPLFALAMLPLGPAISAALYTVRARYRSEDAGPWRAFWRGYRLNFFTVLKFWVPALILLGIIGFSLAFGYLMALSLPYRIGLFIVGGLVVVIAMHAVSIATFFNFRFTDTLRLAAYQLFTNKLATVGMLVVAVLAFGLLWFANEFVLLLAGGLLAILWFQQERPVLNSIYHQFTVPNA